jgi:fatty acid desaturase
MLPANSLEIEESKNYSESFYCKDSIFPDPDGSRFDIRQKLWLLTCSLPAPVHLLLQSYFDWLTGKPYLPPLWNSNPYLELLFGILELLLGLTCWLYIGFHQSGYFLMPVSWFLTVASYAQFREIAHHCVHNRFSQQKALNYWLGTLITSVIQITEFNSFRNYHNTQHHHPEKLATMEHDPANKPYLVYTLHFKLGMRKQDYWKRLWQVTMSPAFHAQTLLERVKGSLIEASSTHRVLSFLWFAIILSLAAASGSWIVFLLWLVPSQILFQIVILLQLLTEHIWGYIPTDNESAKEALIGKCMSRFLGSPPPEVNFLSEPKAWIKWAGEILGYIITRMAVLCLNLPAHSYHHAFPMNHNWTNEIYDLQSFISSGCPNYPGQFPEVWGFWNSVDVVFESLSRDCQKSQFSRDVEHK